MDAIDKDKFYAFLTLDFSGNITSVNFIISQNNLNKRAQKNFL